jgi:C1A family cysteine protease
MLYLFALVSVVSAAGFYEYTNAFNMFMKKYDVSYDSVEEYAKRLAIFTSNMEKVAEMNAAHVLINGEAVYGVSKFADLTTEEFKATYLGYVPSNATKTYVDVKLDGPVANDIDWYSKGAVTPVKDQGQCGSCWAFSATAAIESYAQLAGKGLIVLSAQQINSCDKRDGGCNGGNTESAYDYVKGAGGIETEEDYPYTSGGGSTGSCKFNSGKIAISISGYHSVSRGESSLKTGMNAGPLSLCLAASSWQHYSGGIKSSCDNNVDHCVQGVGYSGSSYWTIRNSWGTRWGEQGMIRLAQGQDLCKVSDDATYPTYR